MKDPTDHWVITTTGRWDRMRHRLRADGWSICGRLRPSHSVVTAELTITVCGQCAAWPIDRAAALANYTVDAAGCWIWGGFMDRNGYGNVHIPGTGRSDWVHRVSYQHHVGEIPDRHEIDHVCQVTACMNPRHLESVTKSEHAARTVRRLGHDDSQIVAAHLRRAGLKYREIADALGLSGLDTAHYKVKSAIRKGLIDPEEIPPTPKLTDAERADICAMYLFGIPQKEIGLFFGVDSSRISRICNGIRGRQKPQTKRVA